MYQNHKDVLPNLITLAELASILPIHTEDCKRGFSKQNLIKSKLRNRIEDAALNRLMMISIEGRPLEVLTVIFCVQSRIFNDACSQIYIGIICCC